MLEHDAETAPNAVAPVREVGPENAHGSALGPLQRGKDLEERGLAAAVRAEKPEDLPARNLEIDVRQRLPLAVHTRRPTIAIAPPRPTSRRADRAASSPARPEARG
jgi:hypothetical protein